MNGVLILDKPAGLTSHDVVHRARRILGQRSIGHLGTLDPLATGVLPLVVGNFTRLAQFYLNSEKVYEGTIRFGFSTDTYDAEGEPTSAPKAISLQKEELKIAADHFRGVIQQVPPPFSAKKIKGVPAYKLARKQKEVVLQPAQVEVKEFEILSIEIDRVCFRARVTSGTYMRSIAHDMGQALGCGAHLEILRRTAVAEFTLVDAHTLDELAVSAGKTTEGTTERGTQEGWETEEGTAAEGNTEEAKSREEAKECSPRRKPFVAEYEKAPEGLKNPIDDLFIHPRKLLPHLPSVTCDDSTAARIRAGRTVNLPDLSRSRQVKVFSGQKELIAIATRVAGTLFHAKLVLCSTNP
jgi:tRNA pseudouridine55 synthase